MYYGCLFDVNLFSFIDTYFKQIFKCDPTMEITSDQLQQLNVVILQNVDVIIQLEQLSSECRKRKLPTSGSKDEIVPILVILVIVQVKRLTVAIEIEKSQQQTVFPADRNNNIVGIQYKRGEGKGGRGGFGQ